MYKIGVFSFAKRSGCTTNAINIARYIASVGYPVAVIEPVDNPAKTLIRFKPAEPNQKKKKGNQTVIIEAFKYESIFICPEYDSSYDIPDVEFQVYDYGTDYSKLTDSHDLYILCSNDDGLMLFSSITQREDWNDIKPRAYMYLAGCSADVRNSFKHLIIRSYPLPYNNLTCHAYLSDTIQKEIEKVGYCVDSVTDMDSWEVITEPQPKKDSRILEKKTAIKTVKYDEFGFPIPDLTLSDKERESVKDTAPKQAPVKEKTGMGSLFGLFGKKKDTLADKESVKEQARLKKESLLKEKQEKERKAKEDKALADKEKEEQLRLAKEERLKNEEAAKKKAEAEKAEKEARIKAEKEAKAEAARIAKEKADEDLKAKKEEERLRREEDARIKAEKLEQDKALKEEQKRLEAEKKAEEDRLRAEKKAEDERIAAEKRAENERLLKEKRERERIQREEDAAIRRRKREEESAKKAEERAEAIRAAEELKARLEQEKAEAEAFAAEEALLDAETKRRLDEANAEIKRLEAEKAERERLSKERKKTEAKEQKATDELKRKREEAEVAARKAEEDKLRSENELARLKNEAEQAEQAKKDFEARIAQAKAETQMLNSEATAVASTLPATITPDTSETKSGGIFRSLLNRATGVPDAPAQESTALAIREEKVDAKLARKANLLGHIGIFVTSVEHGACATHTANSIAAAFAKMKTKSCIVHKVGDPIPDNPYVFESSDGDSGYAAGKIIVYDRGPMIELTREQKAEYNRSDIKIMCCKAEKTSLGLLAKFIHSHSADIDTWIFVFNNLSKDKKKEIEGMMADYCTIVLPPHDIDNIDANIAKMWTKTIYDQYRYNEKRVEKLRK